MASNSPNAVLSLLVLFQLGGALAFVLGGLYVLYCFNRAAAGLERMADVAEAWLALQHYQVSRAQQTQTVASQIPQNIETIEPPSPQTAAPHNP